MEYDLFIRDSPKDSWPIEPAATILASDRKTYEKTNWDLGWTMFKYVQRNDVATSSGSNSSIGSNPDPIDVRV